MDRNIGYVMVVMHYTLGAPPERSGGMTRYAIDLMCEQSKSDRVVHLYPSGYRWWSRKIYWRMGRKMDGVESIELKNSFPIPLMYGVRTPKDLYYSRNMSHSQMESLYKFVKPDVFHIHTLMGLPKELVQYLKERGVKIILTTHDYFGLCPKVNLIDHQSRVCDGASQGHCTLCNSSSRRTLFLRLRNSGVALGLKNRRFIKTIRDVIFRVAKLLSRDLRSR